MIPTGILLLSMGCFSSPQLMLSPGSGWVAYWNVWELTVLPTETDPKIEPGGSHLVYIPADEEVEPRNLFLFLPGTFGAPSQYSDFLKAAARHGQHVIGLSYINHQATRPICNTGPDRHCHGELRAEIILGLPSSPHIEVDRANSIEGRLVSLLRKLDADYPEQGWNRYLHEDSPRWDRIAVSGYSQGAGHAAYIAHHMRVLKAGLYSGPGDVNEPLGSRPAAWLDATPLTPPSRIAGFTHRHDEVARFDRVRANWSALGLTGASIDIDREAPTSTRSRQYHTNLPAAKTNPYANHASTIRDLYIPRDEHNHPLFLNIWREVSWP